MKKRLLLLLAFTLLLTAFLGAGNVAFATTAIGNDPNNDQLDPFITQNSAVKANCSGGAGYVASPFACQFELSDIKSWSLDFNGSSITLKITVDGVIPRPGPGIGVEAPPGFVGGSYRVVFNNASQQNIAQITGRNCAAYTDNHTAHKPHQDTRSAECTNAYSGPFFASDGWKYFMGYGAREDLGKNVGGVEWGWFDPAYDIYWFNNLVEDENCTTGAGFVLGGGLRPDGAACRWSAAITTASTNDTVEVRIPYRPTWQLADDGDDNGAFFANCATPGTGAPQVCTGDDEARGYSLAAAGNSITGIVVSTWVDQVVGLPTTICNPGDALCEPPEVPGPSFDAGACITGLPGTSGCAVGLPTVAQFSAWAAAMQQHNPQDCSPKNQQASCLQELGGFIYLMDWSCGGSSVPGCNANDGYNLGIAGPDYYPSNPRCRYPASIIVRAPSGVGMWQDPNRRDGHTGVILTYGVNVYQDPNYHPETNYASGRKPGYTNVAVPARPGQLPPQVPWISPQTHDNPLSNVEQANPVLQEGTTCYSRSALGAQYEGGASATA